MSVIKYVHKGNDVSARPIKKHEVREIIANEDEIPDHSDQKLVDNKDKDSERKSIDIQHSEASVHLDATGNKEERKEPTFGERFSNTLKKTGAFFDE